MTDRHGDLCAAVEGDAHADDEIAFFEHHAACWGLHPFYGARTRDWKYAHCFGPDDGVAEELYHLAADPAHAGVKAGPEARAEAWWWETDGRDFGDYESDAFRANEHNRP